jgi:hypothetical protein
MRYDINNPDRYYGPFRLQPTASVAAQTAFLRVGESELREDWHRCSGNNRRAAAT